MVIARSPSAEFILSEVEGLRVNTATKQFVEIPHGVYPEHSEGFRMTLRVRLLHGIYTEHFDFLSTGSVNVLAMTRNDSGSPGKLQQIIMLKK